jgi:hypothetical protein
MESCGEKKGIKASLPWVVPKVESREREKKVGRERENIFLSTLIKKDILDIPALPANKARESLGSLLYQESIGSFSPSSTHP